MKAVSLSCAPRNNLTVIATTYYFRQVVPSDLRGQVQQSVFRVSLRTSDKRKATHKASFLYAMMWQLFTSLRRGDTDMEHLTANQIKRLVAEWIETALTDEEQMLATRGHTFRFRDEHGNNITAKENAETSVLLASDLSEQLADCNYHSVETIADQLLIGRSLPIDRHTGEYKLLCRELLKAEVLYLNIMSERYMGNYNSRHEAEYRMNYARYTQPQRTPTAGQENEDMQKPLSFFADLFVDECTRKNKWVARSVSVNHTRYQFLVDLVGNPKLGDITRESLTEALLLLYKFPKNWKKSDHYKTWTIERIKKADIPEEDRMSWKTINGYCSQANMLFSWIKTFHEGKPWLNAVFEPPKRDKHEASGSATGAFTTDELQRIFSCYMSAEYRDSTRSQFVANRCWFWLPLIALYTGARTEELSQLYLSDFKHINGVKCIDISELAEDGKKTKDKNLKNETSIRQVPLHPQLLDLGLWELVEAMKDAGKTRLFEELALSNDGRYGKGYSQQFNRFLTSVGVKDDEGEKARKCEVKRFYSFRHTFLTYCAKCRLPRDLRERITGHSVEEDGVSEKNYINKKTYIESAFDLIINNIDFGIDLSHLKGHEYTRYDG